MRVAVVGATGAVGQIMLRTLERRGFEAEAIVPFASERSAGRKLDGYGVIRPLTDETVQGYHLALFSAGGSTSKAWAEKFVAGGAVVVDNSSAWRMDPDVPLVVSEVNPDAMDEARKGIIANPNCTTMVAMLPAKALHDAFGMTAMVATSYQAAGGAGQKGIDELAFQVPVLHEDITLLVSDGRQAASLVESSVHANTLAYNVVPLLGDLGDNGYTDEEMKLQNESRKILGLPDLAVSPTCVRVPVMVGHAIQVKATYENDVDLGEALEVLRAFPNLVVEDAPTPLEAAGRDETFVGRVRVDLADPKSLNFFVVGDNLLKGAALNTVQLAELAVARGLVVAPA
ncbi:MAG TPA: aspartate-semialdehyde dehydrogenase [Solirubrobacteraceae bacterium]|nr:aspartate-semialdehyde dehydrogenase [Solirubrobacteraceae bacterium]